jgi:hypothetical protein
VLAIEDCHGPIRCFEVVKQAGSDGGTTGLTVPLSVGLERRAVGVDSKPAAQRRRRYLIAPE